MAITLFAARALIAPFNLLMGFGRARAPRALARGVPPFQPAPVRTGAARLVAGPAGPSAAAKPLRVVRAAEPWRAPAGAGRMVISGRMADVCAELDRLANLEAGTTHH